MVLKQGRYERPPEPRSMYTLPEKAAAAASYLPCMIGFLIGIVYILAKGPGCDRSFFRFHFYQAIFLSVLMFLIQALGSGMSGVIIGTMRLFEGLIGTGTVGFLSENMNLVTMVLMAPFVLLVPYGMIFSLMGKYADIPWVSRVIRSNMAGT
jgi:hypothetical protein